MSEQEKHILSKLVDDLLATLPADYWSWVDSLDIKVLQVAR